MQELYFYSDESGIFDYIHNDFFVYGGLVLINKTNRNVAQRRFYAAEQNIRKIKCYENIDELKAYLLKPRDKRKLFSSLSSCMKFCSVINEKDIKTKETLFKDKKNKQRFLDYAYKLMIKEVLQFLIKSKIISCEEPISLYFYIDEHSTATNGRYELEEALENEFKRGTYNLNYNHFFPPILPNIKKLKVYFCDSKTQPLVRASDIIANRVFYEVKNNKANFKKFVRRNAIIFKSFP